MSVERRSWRVERRRLLLVAMLSFAGQPLAAQRTAVIAIRGGTVLTIAGPVIPGGTVLIRGGKISAVGANVLIPNDATVVDESGKYVSPGIIDPMPIVG